MRGAFRSWLSTRYYFFFASALAPLVPVGPLAPAAPVEPVEPVVDADEVVVVDPERDLREGPTDLGLRDDAQADPRQRHDGQQPVELSRHGVGAADGLLVVRTAQELLVSGSRIVEDGVLVVERDGTDVVVALRGPEGAEVDADGLVLRVPVEG